MSVRGTEQPVVRDGGEIRNNNEEQAVVVGEGEGEGGEDTNANEIQTDDDEGRTTGGGGDAGGLPTLRTSSQTSEEQQDKIIIWGTLDSQCDDPELAEFEMLECQELDAYLVEEGEEGEEEGEGLGGAGNKLLYDEPLRCSMQNKEPTTMTADKSREGRKAAVQQGGAVGEQQDATAADSSHHMSGSRGTVVGCRTEFSSETDVFVSCLSTMSSLGGSLASGLDTAGRTQGSDVSWHVPSGPYRTISEDLTLASQSCTTTASDRSRAAATQRADNPSSFTSGTTTSTIQKGDVVVDLNQNNTTILGSEDPVVLEAQEVSNGVGKCKGQMEDVNVNNGEHNENLAQRNNLRNAVSSEGEGDRGAKAGAGKGVHICCGDHNALHNAERTHGKGPKTCAKHCQTDEPPDMNHNPPKSGTKGIPSVEKNKHVCSDKPLRKQGSFDQSLGKKQGSFDQTLGKKQASFDQTLGKKQASFDQTLGKKQASFDRTLKKQASFENSRSSSPSSLERRKPWGSPSRTATPPSPKTTWSPQKRPLTSSPAKVQSTRAPSPDCNCSPKRSAHPSVLKQPSSKVCVGSSIPKPLAPQQKTDAAETRKSSPPQKPKHVRPKIITYVRKSPQAKAQVTGEEAACHSPPAPQKDPKTYPAVHCSSNLLYDKYRQEVQQKPSCYSPGVVVSGIRPPGHTKLSESSFTPVLYPPGHTKLTESSFTTALYPPGETPDSCLHEEGSYRRSPRTLRPQLGLGAVTRQPAAKTRVLHTGQMSALIFSHPAQTPGGVATHGYQDPTADQRRSASEITQKPLLPRPGPSGLRPPALPALPPARLASFGFVRSASVSSVSSSQSTESCHSDPCPPSHRPGSGSDADTPVHRAAPPPDPPCPHSHSSPPQPPNAPAPQRRSLLPPPRAAPVGQGRGRCAGGPGGGSAVCDVGQQQQESVLVGQLRARCEAQARQLTRLQEQLKTASLGLEAFSITTQHFSQKSDRAIVKESELSLELARIRDEVAFSVRHWERLQQDKEALERRFAGELRGLRAQQQRELGAAEERLRLQHQNQTQRMQARQHLDLQGLRDLHQEQMEEMSESHEESMSEMETTHHDTLATLREEHARTVKNLKMAHEQQRKSLEEDFEKLRLSLQDQVDTLTFQNRSLRDRAKRFEEALRRSTDEQIVDALAPYQHIEEDLKSLKDVLEMKNQQIHGQEMKISELERMAQKNVFLEERVQVLQQQNEDLRARIDKNLAMSRQLSEENANLQENVEKESSEKKRLSRNNEELLWRLQTELSPHMSPTSSPLHHTSSASPIHRSTSSGPGSPARPHSSPR